MEQGRDFLEVYNRNVTLLFNFGNALLEASVEIINQVVVYFCCVNFDVHRLLFNIIGSLTALKSRTIPYNRLRLMTK